MIYRSANPLADFAAQDLADYEAEQKCPVCSNCGKQDQVSFQPRGDAPVYCRECFAAMRAQRG
jgi:CxxC-x17-CxxC domain-containing protein